MQFYNNELYVKYYWGSSFISQGTNLLKYNLNTGEEIFDIGSYGTTYFKVMNDGIYITGFANCNYAYNPYGCARPYALKKLHFDGTPDTGFQNGGTFSYSFYPSADSYSGVFIKDNNGKILIGGVLSGSAFSSAVSGNTFIRLGEGGLNTEKPELADGVNIYPNPFSDRLTIQSQYEITEAAIFDINGRNVDNPKIITEEGQTIVITNISQKGLYILKATTTEGRQIVQKIIKE